MDKLLLLDYNSLLYKAVNVHKHYTWGGAFTGGLYGFVNQFCKSVNIFEPNYLLLCSDLPPYIRRNVYPDYKANRKKDPEIGLKIDHSRTLVNEFVTLADIPIWAVEGYEADDLFAVLVEHYHDKVDEILIYTSDDDMFPILHYPNVNIIDSQGDKLCGTDVTNIYGVKNLEDWPKIKAMSGTHNNIPGLKGIGLTKALGLYKKPDAFDKVWEDNKEILDFYYSLIKLPYDDIRPVPNIRMPKFNLRTAINYLARHGFDIKLHMNKAFEYLEEEGRKYDTGRL